MRIDVSMNRDEHKFTVANWWATSPAFVLHTLKAQLACAAVMFPELEQWELAEKVTPSSGCVFCDIGLETETVDGVVGHRADQGGDKFVPCPLASGSAAAVGDRPAAATDANPT